MTDYKNIVEGLEAEIRDVRGQVARIIRERLQESITEGEMIETLSQLADEDDPSWTAPE